MASNLRVDTILPSSGTTLGIGTANGTTNFTGNVGIAGTLTYEDVTNVDSVGVITARNGIRVGAGKSIGSDGAAVVYYGDGSNLTGIDATQILTGNTNVQTVDTGSDGHVKINTEGSERLRIASDGKIGINNASPSANGIDLIGPNNGNGEILVSRSGGTSIQIQSQASLGRFGTTSNHNLQLMVNSGGKVDITTGGAVLPVTDDTQDLGSSGKRWANLYTGDLHLSNSGSGNSVDGTSGSWTMQEGSDDLFLINNKTGKKYKFNLTEVN